MTKEFPTHADLFEPLIQAMHQLGGSGTNTETEAKVAEIMNLTESQLNEIHRGNRTKFSYRLAWARNYLKRYGLLENSERGVWVLTDKGQSTNHVDPAEVNRYVKGLDRNNESIEEGVDEGKTPEEISEVWQDQLVEQMLILEPKAFEMLCQRVLRESGFVEVEVTGRSGDGGIDGKGIVRVNGFLGFNIIFQCKRYSGSVASKEIRDFRGAMVGRADKGLFITTGIFTRDAKKEATRDGAPQIDLIDGYTLAEKMKQLNLGVKKEVVENVSVDESWFKQFSKV